MSAWGKTTETFNVLEAKMGNGDWAEVSNGVSQFLRYNHRRSGYEEDGTCVQKRERLKAGDIVKGCFQF